MDTCLLVCVVHGQAVNDDSLSAVFSKWLRDMESEIHILSMVYLPFFPMHNYSLMGVVLFWLSYAMS